MWPVRWGGCPATIGGIAMSTHLVSHTRARTASLLRQREWLKEASRGILVASAIPVSSEVCHVAHPLPPLWLSRASQGRTQPLRHPTLSVRHLSAVFHPGPERAGTRCCHPRPSGAALSRRDESARYRPPLGGRPSERRQLGHRPCRHGTARPYRPPAARCSG